ncbi:hypothetical protein C8R46DRAFT_1097059 [Mycena filopes]|nr:hypothetical protein C8R46DRAFT_1097059 [Mycena filopes]
MSRNITTYFTSLPEPSGPPYKIMSLRRSAATSAATQSDSTATLASPASDAASGGTMETDSPLPSLRMPATHNEDDDVAPLPTLRTARIPSPDPFEPEDEEDITYPHEGPFITGIPVEATEPVQNPVQAATQAQSANNTQQQSALLVPSTTRSMVAQTARSWETRTGTVIPRDPPTSNALSRTSTAVSFDGVAAPSDLEIFTLAHLIPPPKGEKAADRKTRTDENELRISTHIVAILRRIDELERMTGERHREILLRLEDAVANAPTSAPAENVAGVVADIAALKSRSTETRNAVSGLLGAVNNLMDVPNDLVRLTRRVDGLNANQSTIQNTTREVNHELRNDSRLMSMGSTMGHRTPAPTASAQNAQREHEWRERESNRRDAEFYGETNGNNPAQGGNKRERPFSGFGGASGAAAKKPKTTNRDDPTYDDVYLWDVDTGEASPAKIAHTAMERLGMNSTNAFHSVKHAPNAPRCVISIRFRNSDIAEQFINNMRANAPKSMEHLHAARRAVYEKRSAGNNDRDPW